MPWGRTRSRPRQSAPSRRQADVMTDHPAAAMFRACWICCDAPNGRPRKKKGLTNVYKGRVADILWANSQ